jgi:hypothetical protein
VRVVLVVSELLPIVEDEEGLLGVDELVVVSVDELVEPVVPLAPIVVVLPVLALGLVVLVLELVLGLVVLEVEPLAPMLDVLGDVLELDVLALAPPWPAEPEVEPAEAPVPAAPEAPVPLDCAIATPPIARAAAAASVVRTFLDMSRLLEMTHPRREC